MEKETIKIKVIGLSKVGKSAVARLVLNHLSELGLVTSLIDEPKNYNDEYNPSAKLNSIVERNVNVEIETVQARRDGSFLIKGDGFE